MTRLLLDAVQCGALAMLAVYVHRGHARLRAEERELAHRIAVLFDRLNERDGRVQAVRVSEPRADLPAARVVKR